MNLTYSGSFEWTQLKSCMMHAEHNCNSAMLSCDICNETMRSFVM